MGDIVLFKPNAGVRAETNLRDFIALCKNDLTAFGADLPWESNSWDLTSFLGIKSKRSASRAVFSTWATAKDASPTSMQEPMLSFCKGYFRYQHAMRPTKSIGSRLAAERALDAALAEAARPPWLADITTFARASQMIQGHFSPGAAYRVGGQLEMIAAFMDTNGLVDVPLQWRCPIRRPDDDRIRVGEEFDKRRSEKLPSPYTLDSLARAYRAAEETYDVLITSVAAVLMSAPDRINEVLLLRSDCETKSEPKDGKPTRLGLRFWPSKGAPPMIKWLVPSMVDVVREALSKIRSLTDEARRIAAWYQSNPKALYLADDVVEFRGRRTLNLAELGRVLFEGSVSRTALREWCFRHGVPISGRGMQGNVSFARVQKVVIGMLPKSFPTLDAETGLTYSDALCVIQKNALHQARATYRCAIDRVDHGNIHTGLGGRSEHGFRSVFERLQLLNPDGSAITINTHEFRHYLNTLAHVGGMSELDIAKWSGRMDVRQNRAYDHRSGRDIVEHIRQSIGGDGQVFKTPVAIEQGELIARVQFGSLGVFSAHTTDFGYCVHDYTMTPCQVHLDCLHCNELVCVKGDAVREANVLRCRAETESLLAGCQAAEQAGDFGANRWVEHQKSTLARLNELAEIFANPLVPTGAVIQLKHIKPASRLAQASARRRGLKGDDAAVGRHQLLPASQRPKAQGGAST